mgnify:CR=1 FL=1
MAETRWRNFTGRDINTFGNHTTLHIPSEGLITKKEDIPKPEEGTYIIITEELFRQAAEELGRKDIIYLANEKKYGRDYIATK